MGNTTRPRYGAIVLGALCAVGAAAVLVEDIRHTHTVTVDHLLAVLVLVGTIAAGVMAGKMLATWRTWHYAAALLMLAFVGSLYCLMGTAGRTAEGRATAQLEAEAKNQARAEVLANRAKDQDRLDKKRDEHARECASGRGKRCDGIMESLKVYEAAVKGHEADLARLGPAVPVNTKIKNAAGIVAALRGADAEGQARIEAALMLIEPNIPALFLEAGSIVFFHIGLAGGLRRGRAGGAQEEIDLYERMKAFEASEPPPAPQPPKPGRRSRRSLAKESQPDERRRQVESFALAFQKKHGRPPEPREVRAAIDLPRSTSHRYLREIVAA
ncbi:MAG TPA: hypothetical protein PK857_06920 [Hyphomicrobium sp.]|nr:hypothetical protein [Hyphomicrobium sp.]HRO48754.1 hypothetical protein [Hyphomicrobium sp.]